MFAFADKDRSQALTIEEFSRGLSGVLAPNEALTLFMALDTDGSKVVTFEEMVAGCDKIYASYILHKLRAVVDKMGIDKVFGAVDDDGNN